MDEIEQKVVEMLERGVEASDIAKHLNLTLEEVLDIEEYACENRDVEFESDGQPDEYTEWQDYMDGDDWDHGQYDDY